LALLGGAAPVVLVHGPSGDGKSVLLHQHAEHVPGTVLVDEEATDDEVLAGLRTATQEGAPLAVDAADRHPDEVVRALVAAASSGHVPRLVLAARSWPAPVRDVQGRIPVVVVDHTDLLLTPDEVRRLVVEQGGEMTPAQAARVVQETDGTPSLVGLGLVRGRTVWWSSAALREAVAAHARRHVPEDLRRHVVFLPLLQVYSGTAVRGLAGDDGDDLLALLDRLGVGPRDWRGRAPWHSVHADLARALGVPPQDVVDGEPAAMAGVVRALHGQGSVLDAVRQGVRSRSWEPLAEVLEQEWPLVLLEDPSLLQSAMATLPGSVARRRPGLDALGRALHGELGETPDGDTAGRRHALLALAAMSANRHAGRLPEALAQAESAEAAARSLVDGRPGTSRTVPWEHGLAVTHAGITRFMAGDLRGSVRDFSTALHAEAGGGPAVRVDAAHKLALAYAMQGDLREARRVRDEPQDVSGSHPWLPDHVRTDGLVVDAFLALESLDRAGAQAALSAVTLPSRQHELWFVVALLRVRLARLWGGAADALEALRVDVATHAPKDERWLTHHVVVAGEAEANLSLGRGTRAAALLSRSASQHPLVELARGRMHLLAGDPRLASLSLARCEGPHAYRRVRVEAMVLRARAAHAAGEPSLAGRLLQQALAQAEAGGVLSPFAALGDRSAAWLRTVPGLGAVLDRLDEAGVPAVDADPVPVVPLSPREQEVLELLAGGLGVDQVAARLVLSRNTVKTHVRRLYRSLGVSSWSAAVERGHELGLLDG
jgi:DNA-binding CsgD family transcriptional regulator